MGVAYISQNSHEVTGDFCHESQGHWQLAEWSCGHKQPFGTVTCINTYCSSLVPRPSTPPVFDLLQNAKTEGEGLGNLIMSSCLLSTARSLRD